MKSSKFLDKTLFMVKLIFLSSSLFLFILLQSCGQQEITLNEIPPYAQKLVVNGTIGKNGASLFISNSASAYGGDSVLVFREGTVKLATNSGAYDLVYNPSVQRFVINESFPEGMTYSLTVNRSGFSGVSSSGMIPQAINYEADYIPDGGVDTSGFTYDKIFVKFSDPRGQKNFYRINFLYHDDLLNQFFPFYFDLNHPGLNSRNTMVLRDGSVIFNDDLIDGRNIEFNIIPLFGTGFGNLNYKYLVQFESISEDLYRYYITIDRAREAGNGGFGFGGNPVIVHSNIVNGLGIFGATNANLDTLSVK